MSTDQESKASIVLIASLIRQLQARKFLGENDIAAIFGHADEALPGKQNPKLDAIWLNAQEIIAG
jgi:hypothetical protein